MHYVYTAALTFARQWRGGLGYLLLRRALEVAYLLPMLLLWRTLLGDRSAQDAGATLGQMLSYTYCNALLAEQLNVRTALSDTFYEGGIIGLYLRPMGMLGQVAAQTVGSWLPRLCLFSLPMALLAVPLGIDLRPQTLWALPSLACAISLGFAVDYLFAGMTIRVPNAIWLVHVIRMALTGLFSGALIPFALLPWGLGDVLAALPLGSLAGAPLSLYVGLARPQDVLPTQLLWNLLLWPLALWLLAKSRERMVAFGG